MIYACGALVLLVIVMAFIICLQLWSLYLQRKLIIELKVFNVKLKEELVKYLHEYHSTRGLWCTDRDPKKCNLIWIRKNSFQLKDDLK